MQNLQQTLAQNAEVEKHTYKPVIYRPTFSKDREALIDLIKQQSGLMVHDELLGQLEELIKCQQPTVKFDSQSLQTAALNHLGTTSIEDYGVWVHYPWSNRLVHLLDEAEFTEVRTNRNRNKITKAEQERLAQLKIGIIGLSVGQSVALTLAMERGFGELRIADFDKLELSNLNRIRTGVHTLELPKTIAVAREIAEIDPFLNVVLYNDGLTEGNITDFLSSGGKLDLLIDECDGLDIKILARKHAREHRIPVIMDTSDRGMVDVERFDLEPNRSILHGLVDHLDIENVELKGLTTEEKIPYVLPMIGADTMSKRMKASMVEIEQTLTTWPQLASSVVMGGAMAADISRRIALGSYTSSGRYFIDLEELIANPNTEPNQLNTLPQRPAMPDDDALTALLEEAASSAEPSTVKPKPAEVEHFIADAIAAPSTANNQPWKWMYLAESGVLGLFHDISRTDAFGDFDLMSTHLSQGAAIENLNLSVAAAGYEMETHLLPLHQTLLTAFFTFNAVKNHSTITNGEHNDALYRCIGARCTNRNYDERKPIPEADLHAIAQAVSAVKGAKIDFATTATELDTLAHVIGAGDRLRFLHPEGHFNFFAREIRWTKEENELKRDGLDIATIDLRPSDIAGLQIAKDPEVVRHLNNWRGGKAFETMSGKAVMCAGAIGFIRMPAFDHAHVLNGGRAMERAWLAATQAGLAFQPLMSPPFFFMQLLHGNGEGFPQNMQAELRELRKDFNSVFEEKPGAGEVFLFRLAQTDREVVRSLRRPVDDVLRIVE